jgi:hypothetical protein
MHGVGGKNARVPGTQRLKHGIYSKHLAARLRQRSEELLLETDPTDVAPELAFLRALLEDYIENFETIQDALLAWYGEEGERPQSLPTMLDAVRIIEAIARVSATYVRNREKEAISKKAFRQAIQDMDRILRLHVSDEEIVDAIYGGWQLIEVGNT